MSETKYRVKLNSGRVVGPFDTKGFKELVSKKHVDGSELFQEFPVGSWKKIAEFSLLLEIFEETQILSKKDATFLINLAELEELKEKVEEDSAHSEDHETVDGAVEFKFDQVDPFADQNFETEVEEKVEEENPPAQEPEFDKTVVRRVVKEDLEQSDKTQINLNTKDYLEKLKKEKEEKDKEEAKKAQEVEDKVDYNADATQMLSLDDLKKDLAKAEDVANKIEAAERISTKKKKLEKVKAKKESKEKIKEIDDDYEEEEESLVDKIKEFVEEKRKLLMIVGVVGALLMFLSPEEEQKKVKKITVLSPKIVFPIQFDSIADKIAAAHYKKGLKQYSSGTYISELKAAKSFRTSAENKFKKNVAMGKLIYLYSRFLDNTDNFGRDANTVFKLVQIFKYEANKNANYTSAIALFYYKNKKYEAANRIIERYTAFPKNKPTIELFTVYLRTLLGTGDLIKAAKIAKRLESVKKKNHNVYETLIDYYKFQKDFDKLDEIVKIARRQYPSNAKFLLERGDYYLRVQNKKKLAKTLAKVRSLQAGKSKVNYAEYLRLRGMYFVLSKNNKRAIKDFKKSLKLVESIDLIAQLADLENSNNKEANELIAESKALKFINEAQKAQLEGNDNEALKYALEATNVAPDFIKARIYLASLQSNLGYLNDAIIKLSALFKEYRSSTEVLYALIDVYTESYKFKEVKRLLKIARTISEEGDSRYFSATAKYFKFKGDFNKTAGWLKKAIKSNPLDDTNVYELAKLYIKYNKFNKGMFYLKKAMELDPAKIEYRVSYAQILYEVESVNSAIGYLYDVLKKFPDDPKLMSSIGIYFYRSGQIKKYEDLKAKLLSLPKKDASLFNFLIEAAKLDEDYDAVIQYCIKLIELDPSDLDIRLYLSQLYIEKEKYGPALKELTAIKSRLSSYPKLKYFFSKLYLLSGEIEKAKMQAESEVKENPTLIDGYILMGEILKKEKELSKARKYFFKANQIDPKSVDALLGLAYVAFMNDQYDMALDYYKKAAELDPNRSEVYKLLGDVFRKLGQSQLAIKNYSHFLELLPNSKYKNQIRTYINTMK